MKIAYIILPLFVIAACATPKPATKWPAPHAEEVVHICWNKEHTRAINPNSCTALEPLEWPSVPLVVSSDVYTGHYTAAAIRLWNKWLGFEALVHNPVAKNADIQIMYGGDNVSLKGRTILGLTRFYYKEQDGVKKQHAQILMFDSALADPEVYMHELGHALGLAHDPDNRNSIMYPGKLGQFMPKLEEEDRAVLRRRYLKE